MGVARFVYTKAAQPSGCFEITYTPASRHVTPSSIDINFTKHPSNHPFLLLYSALLCENICRNHSWFFRSPRFVLFPQQERILSRRPENKYQTPLFGKNDVGVGGNQRGL
jgi:hypothetical protein